MSTQQHKTVYEVLNMIEHRQKRDAELEEINHNLERIATCLETICDTRLVGIHNCMKA
jgi:hypothetical protein